jgi:hypothetical protein
MKSGTVTGQVAKQFELVIGIRKITLAQNCSMKNGVVGPTVKVL